MNFFFGACFVALVGTNLLAEDSIPAPPPIQVMVLGTYHFGNPGLDLHNMKVESVLTPAKQAELAYGSADNDGRIPQDLRRFSKLQRQWQPEPSPYIFLTVNRLPPGAELVGRMDSAASVGSHDRRLVEIGCVRPPK